MPSSRPQESSAATATLQQRVLPRPEELGGRSDIRPLPHNVLSGSRPASILPDTERDRVALTEAHVEAFGYSLWGRQRKDSAS